MSADYGPAQWIPSSHYWSGRAGHQPQWIIVHGTAGGTSATGIAQYFQTDDPPTSTHYIVGLQGEVVQCVRDSDSAWGNGVVTTGHDAWWSPNLNPNFTTISIEHVKPDTQNQSQLTQAQMEASFQLIESLCRTHNIPMRAADQNGGITSHASIDPVNRSFCPGAYPWTQLWAYLQGEDQHVGVPIGWRDDGATLTAPNGITVTLGFRWYVLTNPWSSDNWPLEAAHYEAIIDVTSPQEGGGTVQHFRRSILAWQQSTNDVLDLWAGATSMTWQQRATTAEALNKNAKGAVMGTNGAPAPVASPQQNGPARATPPLNYMPPLGTPSALKQAGAPQAGVAQAAGAIGGVVAMAATDPVSQRVAGLEQQVQLLLNGLTTNPKTKKMAQQLEKEFETAGSDLVKKVPRSVLSNPKSFLRWLLMIVGILFSDVAAWAVSTFLHHSTSLPVPFLTLGTVLLSGLVFVGTFRAQPH
jgi:hypothetical protein